MASVKLPRFVMFKGECKYNLCLYATENCESPPAFLRFNSSYRDKLGSHEVIPVQVSGEENVVMVRCLENKKFWKKDKDNWILADQDPKPTANWILADKDSKRTDEELNCFFEVVLNVSGSEVGELKPTSVALKCLGNGKYLRSNYNGQLFKSLRAEADINTDPSVLMEVSEALLSRRVSVVKYGTEETEFTKGEPQLIYTTTKKNPPGNCCKDIEVVCPDKFLQKSTWSNSTSFHTGLSVFIKAGIPDISLKNGVTWTKSVFTTAMRVENVTKQYKNPTIVYKQAKPGEEVRMQLWGTKVTGKVKYTYKFQDTHLDDRVPAKETAEDGIFEGEQWVDIHWKATNLSKPEAKPEAQPEPESESIAT